MEQAIKQAKAAIDNGNLLLAYDIAQSAIEAGDGSEELRHLLVLALARMGNAERAMELYHHYGLERSPDAHHRAIVARILKDSALATAETDDRNQAFVLAFEAYERLFRENGDAYPGINAATLAYLGGQEHKARELATAILALPEIADPAGFYAAATKAEALLLLGRFDEAGATLQSARDLPGANSGAKSSSCRQLSLIAEVAGLGVEQSDALLAPILPPSVIHFCGHMFLEDAALETELRKAVDQFLDAHDVGFAYGAIAAGSDILIAEAILARGSELHLTLPFARDDFIIQSITPAGPGWLERFERCMALATSVNFATEMHYVADPSQFGYASKVAMGMAKLRAQYLGGAVQQLAIWDGKAANGPAGTGADVKNWQSYGGSVTIIGAQDLNRQLSLPQKPKHDPYKRTTAAILFTDFQGFSKLSEAAIPTFWNGVMGRMGTVLRGHQNNILAQNSWGDALLAVASGAAVAAEIALELQSALRDFDMASLGLNEAGGMRIGVHYGPTYEMDDPITGKVNYYGTEVSKAARIEPVTPPGAVFVTEPFAAILALEAADYFICQFVGKVQFAKDYGTYPMYRLTAT